MLGSIDHTELNFCFCLYIPFIYDPRSTLALPPSGNSDMGSHSGSSFLLPTTVHAFIFYRGKNSKFPSLVDSRRIVRTHAARRSQQLILLFPCLFANKIKCHHGGNRTQEPTLGVVFEGNHTISRPPGRSVLRHINMRHISFRRLYRNSPRTKSVFR